MPRHWDPDIQILTNHVMDKRF
ncbi:hypothetical protein LB099_04820 [Wolbachia endosymbiont of Nasonia oneida]